jgi:hypothetical protein
MHLTPAQCQDHLQAVLDSLTVLGEDLEELGQATAAAVLWEAVELACQSAATLAAAMWSVQL